jgi:hypothetical protein
MTAETNGTTVETAVNEPAEIDVGVPQQSLDVEPNGLIEQDDCILLASAIDKIELADSAEANGQNKTDQGENVDGQEPKKDPLAIPRKGYFYEHDDRLGDKEELDLKYAHEHSEQCF